MNRKKILLISIIATIIMVTIIIFNYRNVSDSDIAGGPCSYETTVYPIIISEIIAFKDSSFDVRCTNTMNNHFEDEYQYYMTNNSYATKNDIKDLKVGDTICLLEDNIVSGACNPHIISIKLEKYKKE